MTYRPINELPDNIGRTMFVVIGIDMDIGAGKKYTTDPYCVWVDSPGKFARWPHSCSPTHFMLLPDPKAG